MYPFGSGMPQPHPMSAPYNNNSNSGMPVGIPFGAGWIAPTQHPQQHHLQQQHQYRQQQQQHHMMSNTANHPNYPPSNPPYPIYPNATQNSQNSVYMASQNPGYYAPPPLSTAHPSSYSASHGYTPIMTPTGYNSPAGCIAQCFNEMAQSHAHITSHSTVSSKKEGTPTVLPAQDFDPVKDAHDLRKAMKGFGTDEDALINIICRRSNEQRQEIQRQYKTHFGKDLIEDVKSETSGNFQRLMVGVLRPIVDFYCAELNDAMSGIGTDEDVLIEILCTLSNQEIHTIKNQYLRLYGAHLESELKSETSGNFKRLLVSLCTAARDESGHTDPIAAQTDARELLKAGELRVGTDESMFNMILCQRNYQQLKLIFQAYEHMTGHSLEKAIKKEFSGDIMEGLIAIFRCVTNKAEYFASRLHKSMAGIGTNDKQLIRVVITRCEIDMNDIKAAFERLYGKSLKSWIKGDTSGHYKHALYALVGEQRSS